MFSAKYDLSNEKLFFRHCLNSILLKVLQYPIATPNSIFLSTLPKCRAAQAPSKIIHSLPTFRITRTNPPARARREIHTLCCGEKWSTTSGVSGRTGHLLTYLSSSHPRTQFTSGVPSRAPFSTAIASRGRRASITALRICVRSCSAIRSRTFGARPLKLHERAVFSFANELLYTRISQLLQKRDVEKAPLLHACANPMPPHRPLAYPSRLLLFAPCGI
jgi:hypothetical protein